MARKKRQWYPGATYHVMSRGNRRNAIFKEKYDYVTFLEYIELVQGLFPFKLHSVCLMTNHFHMLIETANAEIWKIMQKLLSLYASEFNHRYSYSGHLFEGRYTACAIEDARYFLEVSRYIHLNPVKARMVREPLTYAYSSYGLFVNCEKDKGGTVDKLLRDLVDTSRVLASFHNNPREQYRMFVEGKISHAEQEMLIQKDMDAIKTGMLSFALPENKVLDYTEAVRKIELVKGKRSTPGIRLEELIKNELQWKPGVDPVERFNVRGNWTDRKFGNGDYRRVDEAVFNMLGMSEEEQRTWLDRFLAPMREGMSG